MTIRALTATTPDGTADGALLLPDGAGPFPLVVFYPDAGGMRPAMTQMGQHLVHAGYAVLQVDPFWRQRPYAPFDMMTVFSDPTERARIMALIHSVQPRKVVSDTEALIAAIDDPRVLRDRFATIGYCMGGRLAYLTAAHLPERVIAAAPIHAGGLVTDATDSPHLLAPQIRAAIYFGVADEDGSCTPDHQAKLKTVLDAAGVRYQLEVNPGARHGYAVPDFPVFHPAAAENHWKRVLALFGDHLRKS